MRAFLTNTILVLFLFSCNMEKEVDLNLPKYESKMVIEAYLMPGRPFQLSIFESVSYFDPVNLPTLDSALVVVSYNSIKDTLFFDPYTDPTNGRFYNYRSPSIVPADYTSEFYLEVTDKSGRVATAQTIIPPPVLIDTVTFEFDKDSMAFALTKFFDNTSVDDYYRYHVERTYLGEEVVDYQFDDKLVNSSEIAVGSTYNLEKGTDVTIGLFHITKDYFDFLVSVGAAQDANGNPFAQPATIKSNITGGIGIFTGLGIDQKQLVVP